MFYSREVSTGSDQTNRFSTRRHLCDSHQSVSRRVFFHIFFFGVLWKCRQIPREPSQKARFEPNKKVNRDTFEASEELESITHSHSCFINTRIYFLCINHKPDLMPHALTSTHHCSSKLRMTHACADTNMAGVTCSMRGISLIISALHSRFLPGNVYKW